jgi:hypothetical protein
LTFVSEQGNPLLVIFYDGPDRSLAVRTIRAGRDGNEYWNFITPYALILGALSQLLIALNFLNRPAFRLMVLTAFFAVFIPLLPMMPPGFALTVFYRRLWWRARVLRAYRDLARLPLKYLPPNQEQGRLPDGEPYMGVYCESLSGEAKAAMENRTLPLLIPEKAAGRSRGWYIFGAVPENGGGAETLPGEPRDVFATYGIIPGNPEDLARRFTYRAYALEVVSWILLLAGISLNIFFVRMIFALLN